ncbi:heterodisulfide reductase [Achromatium sp. WMS2]|nr:heterodisulfide reductase [Achromatium sp. WMS2]
MTAALELGIKLFKSCVDASVAAFFSSCVRCGICAQACLFYTETKEPEYTPIYRLEPLRWVWHQEYTVLGRLLKITGLSRKLTHEDLAEWEALVYDSCTLCGRCSMVCPVGNDIAGMLRKMREGMAASGHAPAGLIAATQRAVTIGSPMGVKLHALEYQIQHVENELGFAIPVDVVGAEYMLLLSSMEIMNFPEFISAVAKLFRHARISWTIAKSAFEATNSGAQIGVSDIASMLVERIVDVAEQLKVKTVVTPECGHAYTALRWDGPNLIGRPYKFKVLHITELLNQLRVERRLRTAGKEIRSLTYHDPCQLARYGGVIQEPRALLNMIANDFVELPESGTMNWCCGAGGGVSSNENADRLRLQAFNRKKQQLDAIRPDAIVTCCSTCRMAIEEAVDEYGMEVPVLGLVEMLAEHILEKKKDRK